MDYHYSTKVKKTKIRFQRYSDAQKILTSDTGERLHIIESPFVLVDILNGKYVGMDLKFL